MECLILKTEPSGESDVIVTMLTSGGQRLEAVARSARKLPSKVRSGILPISISDVAIAPGRQQWILRNAFPVFTFPAFRNSFIGLSTSIAIGAIVAEGSTEVSDKDVFLEETRLMRDLHTALLAREREGVFIRRACAAFLRTLEVLGFAPIFSKCAKCATSDRLTALSSSAGGIVCGSCASSLPDSRALSPKGVSLLADRRVSTAFGDVRQLAQFIGAFTLWHFPHAGSVAVWATRAFFDRGAIEHDFRYNTKSNASFAH